MLDEDVVLSDEVEVAAVGTGQCLMIMMWYGGVHSLHPWFIEAYLVYPVVFC